MESGRREGRGRRGANDMVGTTFIDKASDKQTTGRQVLWRISRVACFRLASSFTPFRFCCWLADSITAAGLLSNVESELELNKQIPPSDYELHKSLQYTNPPYIYSDVCI